jgi:cytochrome c oxidase subunit II
MYLGLFRSKRTLIPKEYSYDKRISPKVQRTMRKHLIIVIIITVVLSAGLAYLSLNTNLIPYPSSVERASIDRFVQVLFAIASVFFVLILTVFIYALVFFRRRPGDSSDGSPIKGNSWLERAWTLIPLVIVLVLAAFGGVVLNNITKAGPAGTEMEIDVTAERFSWQFSYPDYKITSFELHVPVNQRLHLVMQSKDVVHSFWVQEWGPKQDIVPGLTTEVRYTPTKTGQFLVQCSQLCGYGHTYMIASVAVTSASDFQTWVQQLQKATPAPSPAPSLTAAPSTTATPSSTAAPSPSPTSTNPPGAGNVIDLTAQNLAFDLNTITVTAGAQVTINFDNKDGGVPHNFAVYTDSSATTVIFRGQLITGPATVKYTFDAPATPGNYFFRCDVHPTMMTGTFVVK